ncbi:hypothetical protein RMATCC62417_00446 [Rhizopus microsporus]|nr:hypothetical protein RMATCC62417_00446 [Rhizopus microsporus]
MSVINQSSVSSLSSIATEMTTFSASPSNFAVSTSAQDPFSTQSTNNMDADSVSPLSVSSAGSMSNTAAIKLDADFDRLRLEIQGLSSQLASLGSEVSEHAQAIRTAFEVRSRDLTNMSKLYELMNNFSGSSASSSRGASAIASSAPTFTTAAHKTNDCSKEVSYFQWVGGTIFQKNEVVFRDVEACLNKLENAVFCYQLVIDANC